MCPHSDHAFSLVDAAFRYIASKPEQCITFWGSRASRPHWSASRRPDETHRHRTEWFAVTAHEAIGEMPMAATATVAILVSTESSRLSAKSCGLCSRELRKSRWCSHEAFAAAKQDRRDGGCIFRGQHFIWGKAAALPYQICGRAALLRRPV